MIQFLAIRGTNSVQLLTTPTHTHASHLYLVLQLSVRIKLLEELVGSKVKGRDHLLRVAYELGIEVRIESLEVTAIDVQKRLFNHMDLCM